MRLGDGAGGIDARRPARRRSLNSARSAGVSLSMSSTVGSPHIGEVGLARLGLGRQQEIGRHLCRRLGPRIDGDRHEMRVADGAAAVLPGDGGRGQRARWPPGWRARWG